jgi:phosphoglycerate kinase
MTLLKMTDIDLKDKRVLIREDFNVPIENGKITSDARLLAALPTIELALSKGAKIILISHLGRPEEGQYEEKFSLAPIASRLGELLKKNIRFEKNWLEGFELDLNEIVLCENVRFNLGEKKNNEALSRKMADLCDVFVMDAFATAHRAEASTYGVAKFAKVACAGPLLVKELEALSKALKNPARPLIAIVGGSKVSTKLAVLEKLLEKVDELIVGGGIANTFLAATGIGIGKSLYEENLLDEARRMLSFAKTKNIQIHLPTDVVVGKEFSATTPSRITSCNEIFPDDRILDVGPKTASLYQKQLIKAGTIIWNGPVGVFEFPAFANGTKELALAIAESNAFSLAGGGDTLSAIDQFKIENKISYISTGGGAFLEFVEGKKLPAVEILEERGNL